MPIRLFDKESNAPVDIPESDVASALQSGRYLVDGNASYNMVTPEGKPVVAKGADLYKAVRSGLRLESPEEIEIRGYRQEMGSTLKGRRDAGADAIAAGVARGLTLGLSDLVMTKTGMVDPEYLEALRQQEGGASLIGEVGGSLAGGLVGAGKKVLSVGEMLLPSAGASALGRAVAGKTEAAIFGALSKKAVGGQLTKDAIAKATAFAAAGAVEGSLVGVGQAITEEALGDPREFGELLVASVGPSALIGGIAGGVFGAGSEIGGAAFKRMAQRAEIGFAKAIGEEVPSERVKQGFESLGLKGKRFDKASYKLGEERMTQVADVLFDPKVLPDGPIINQEASSIDNLKRVAEAAEHHGRIIDTTLVGADEEIAKFAAAGDSTALELLPSRTKVIDALEDIKMKWGGKTAYKPGVDKISEIQQDLAKNAEPYLSFKEAQELKVSLRQGAKKTVPGEVVPKGTAKDAFNKAEGFVAAEMEDAIDRLFTKLEDQGVYVQYLRSKEIYSALMDAKKLGDASLGKAADSWADKVLEVGKEIFQGMAWRMIYSGRATGSAIRSAATAIGLRRGVEALEEGGGVVMDYVNPSRIKRYATDAAKLAMIQQRAAAFTKKVEGSVDQLLNTKVHKLTVQPAARILSSITGEKDETRAWKTYRQQVQGFVANPDKLATQIAMSFEGLDGAAPNIAAESAGVLSRAVQAIQSAMPQPFNAATLQPTMDDDFEPTSDEMSVFRQTVAAALQPESVLEDLKQGQLTPEAVDTVKFVYPAFYELLKQTIAEKAASAKKMPYNLRVQLAVLFGLPTDPTLEQDFIQRSQLAWAPQGPPQDAKGSPPKLNAKTFSQDSHLTASQRVERGVGSTT